MGATHEDLCAVIRGLDAVASAIVRAKHSFRPPPDCLCHERHSPPYALRTSLCGAEIDVQFRRISHEGMDQPETVYLRQLDWDDWFKFETSFLVHYVDKDARSHRLGTTKIGKFGLRPAGRGNGVDGESRRPGVPEQFDALPESHFSLAQDPSFYEVLSEIGEEVREQVLAGLRDLAYVPDLLDAATNEDVTKVSLLRDVPLLTVREQFARLARGGARLTEFNLKFNIAYAEGKPTISFAVDPSAPLPTNIHVVVGRNGVGKSTFLNKLAAHYVNKVPTEGSPNDSISNLVSISFSAFDAFEPLSVPQDRTKGVTYHYVGLKLVGASKEDADRVKGPQRIATEFTQSARSCLRGAKRSRLTRALRLLETDPVFATAGVSEMVERSDAAWSEDAVLADLSRAFKRFSSGHKIVLLTTTKLIETVSEKSLVLLDEPEAHLHPPLLSAFIRALSDLLIDRNGIGIVATHSPVVLQEVPSQCVWKINRIGDITTLSRPSIETFGENVATLTNEVFGLEVTSTGYHRILLEAARKYGHQGYAAALNSVGGQIGAEGRSVLRAMVEVLGNQRVVS